MTRWLLLGFAMLVGGLLPVQQGVNATLTRAFASPLQGALVSFAVGTLALLLCVTTMDLPLPATGQLSAQPWWAWTGGLIGAAFVTASIVLAPRLGATATVGAVIAGQIVASLLLDHHGLLGFTTHPISFGRLVGVALLIAGVVLIRRF